MKEKLIIKNFGPIKDIELDLGKVTVLIGEQATGKSTVAKVLAVCRVFSNLVSIYLDEQEPNSSPFWIGIVEQGLQLYIQKDSYVYYECEHYILIANAFVNDTTKYDLSILQVSHKLTAKSKEFRDLIVEIERIKSLKEQFTSVEWRILLKYFLNSDVQAVLPKPFYLPTERGLQSIFSLGKQSIANLSNSLFNQLAEMDEIVRHFKNETYIYPVDIYYQDQNGYGFVRKANETKSYSLHDAASGYQSAIPIVLVVKYYNESQKESKIFIIEEPELNLFPKAQYKLMQYLVEQNNKFGNTLLLTTHSPYTLTSLNNLMYAYVVGQKYPDKAAIEIEKKYWLDPKDVSAYMLKTDGSVENIFDEEEGMIKAEKIDGVSSEINKTFDRLLTIEINEGTLDA